MFDYLAKRGFLKNAIVIITADHGECLGEHNLIDHNHLFYASLRVPLIIKIPRYKGKLITYPISSVDIFPTILDLLGYKKYILQLKLRGESLLKKRNITYLQFSEYPKIYSLIKGNWQLYIDFEHNVKMLFNTGSDAQEKENLLDKYGNIYQSLYLDLQDILKTAQKDATTSIDKKSILNKDDVKQLKSLGYLN
jgi:arylsulfatase A-like enzyme